MLPSDETYTMVEDELHDIAHHFTRSLHRAEYQRLQVLAASKNASSISEIQRPNNSIEHGPQAKRHDHWQQGVNQPKGEEGFSSDEEEKERMSQLQGTNLGALMLSPGQRKKDLSAKWKMRATTRAAAGFCRGKIDAAKQNQVHSPLTREGSDLDSDNNLSLNNSSASVYSPSKGREYNRVSVTKVCSASGNTSEDDDDLDAAIMKICRNSTSSTSCINVGAAIQTLKIPGSELKGRPEDRQQSQSQKASNTVPVKHISTAPTSPVFDDFLCIPTPQASILGAGGYRGRAVAALAKRRKMERIS